MTTDLYFRDAFRRMSIGELPASWLESLRKDRSERRAFWSSGYGRRELARLVAESGVFSSVDSDWTDEMKGKRNQIVELLDDMGMLDEANLERLLAYMLTLPEVPDWVAEEMENG